MNTNEKKILFIIRFTPIFVISLSYIVISLFMYINSYELFEKYDEVVIDNLNDYFYSIKRTPTIFEMEDTFKPDEIIMGIKDYSSIKNNFKIYFTRKRDLDGKR